MCLAIELKKNKKYLAKRQTKNIFSVLYVKSNNYIPIVLNTKKK